MFFYNALQIKDRWSRRCREEPLAGMNKIKIICACFIQSMPVLQPNLCGGKIFLQTEFTCGYFTFQRTSWGLEFKHFNISGWVSPGRWCKTTVSCVVLMGEGLTWLYEQVRSSEEWRSGHNCTSWIVTCSHDLGVKPP